MRNNVAHKIDLTAPPARANGFRAKFLLPQSVVFDTCICVLGISSMDKQDTPIIRDFGYRDAQNIGLLNWSANTNLLAPEINETLLHFLKSIIH